MDATAVTSPVVVALTNSGILARYRGAEWRADGTEAGPLALTAFDLIDDDHVAIGGGAVPVPDAVADVLRSAMAGVGAPTPADLLVLPYPTRWGTARREALVAAVHRVAREAVVVQTAVAIADAGDVQAARVVVVECTSLSLTASYVVAQPGGCRVVACEYEPNVGGGYDGSAGAIATLAVAVADHRTVDAVVVWGPCDIEGVGAAVTGRFAGTPPTVAAVDERVVLRNMERQYTPVAVPPVLRTPTATWLEPTLRERRSKHSRPRTAVLAGAGVLAIALVAGAIGLLRSGDGAPQTVVTTTAQPIIAASAPAVPTSSTPTTTTAAQITEIDAGRVHLELPAQWHERTRPDAADTTPPRDSRLELVPNGGADRRIIVMQNTLREGVGYDAVAATLARKIADPAKRGVFGDLQRGALFGGRDGLAYQESPDGSSQVKWHVVVENDMQVSIGCQFLTDEWDAIAGDCERVVRGMTVDP
ncbi:type VII secretion-associated protein [Antrihabitans cavernicola]|uniref:Type VII secretion-associated protein n=1 Tax=Antrihabitans cavernicola TaxID=2495913 RepID=A0A5A7S8F8_9NOCA|nr:type VII secretion-associated protein [Spelaeibacter cavernicola]KAA0021489.1 type VII secretion-associated protein [Spelaeibacter cavernicola]